MNDIYLVDLGDAVDDDEPNYLICYHIETWFIDDSPRFEFEYPANGEVFTVTPEMMSEVRMYLLKGEPLAMATAPKPDIRIADFLAAVTAFATATNTTAEEIAKMFRPLVSAETLAN